MRVIHTHCRRGSVIYFVSSLIRPSEEKPFPLKDRDLRRRGTAGVGEKHRNKNGNKSKSSREMQRVWKTASRREKKNDQPPSDIKEILKINLTKGDLVES